MLDKYVVKEFHLRAAPPLEIWNHGSGVKLVSKELNHFGAIAAFIRYGA